jgi:hypothetical protein
MYFYLGFVLLVLGLYIFHQYPLRYTEKKVVQVESEIEEKLVVNEAAPGYNYFNVVLEPNNLTFPPVSVTSNIYNNPLHKKTLNLLANES